MNALRVGQIHSFKALVAMSLLGVSVLACSFLSPESSQNHKPSHYGVFFEKDGELIELKEQEIFNIPVEKQMGNAQTISDSQPTIVIWRSNTNLDYLEFLKLNQYLGQSKNSVSYNATPKDDGIIEIKPKSALEDGVYCLIQGDPLAASLPAWCFRLGALGAVSLQTASSDTLDSTEPTQQLALDQETLLFRDNALQVVESFDTVEYSFRIPEATNPQNLFKYGNGKATKNSYYEISYYENGDLYYEDILVDDKFCTRGNSSWNCRKSDFISILLSMKNVLDGKLPNSSLDRQFLSYGSKMDLYNGVPCRSFFVDSSEIVNGHNVVYRDELCFDLQTYYPIRWLYKYTSTENNTTIEEFTLDIFDFKFNVPVEIALPQQ